MGFNSAFDVIKVLSFVTSVCCIQPVDRMGTGLVTAGVGKAIWRALLEEREREGYRCADNSLA
jgi:hypothetical protein